MHMRIREFLQWALVAIGIGGLTVLVCYSLGCGTFQRVGDAGLVAADVDGDGVVTPVEAQAAGASVGKASGLPLGETLGGVVGLLGLLGYQEYRRRVAMKALGVTVNAIEESGAKPVKAIVAANTAPGDATNKLISKVLEV